MKRLIDISYYQDPSRIDYDVLLSQVDGVIIRCGYGVRKDTAFETHYSEIKARGIPVGTYHFMVEYKTVDEQLAIVKRALDGKEFELGFWADVELESGATPLTRATVIEYMSKASDFVFGIYTGAWCWNPIMGNDNPYSDTPLWVGSYSSSPYLPIGWDDYWIWQYTSSGKLDGYPGNLDMNRISDEKWEEWIGDSTPVLIGPLEVPLFSQKDSRWASERLGTSSVTIGAYGCLITAASMVCKYYGKDTNPSKINKDLIEVNGYENGNLLKYNAITTIYPDIVVDWSKFLSNPTDGMIDATLEMGLPVIAQVDYYVGTPALEQHWVVIIGKDEHGYLIADPIDGQRAYLSRYAGKAWRMVVYEQHQVEDPLFKVRVIAGALNVRSTPVYKPDGSNKVDLLREGDVVNVYQIADNGWYRIGVDRWISGNSLYTERIEDTPEPPPMTLEERVAKLEERVDILEAAL